MTTTVEIGPAAFVSVLEKPSESKCTTPVSSVDAFCTERALTIFYAATSPTAVSIPCTVPPAGFEPAARGVESRCSGYEGVGAVCRLKRCQHRFSARALVGVPEASHPAGTAPAPPGMSPGSPWRTTPSARDWLRGCAPRAATIRRAPCFERGCSSVRRRKADLPTNSQLFWEMGVQAAIPSARSSSRVHTQQGVSASRMPVPSKG